MTPAYTAAESQEVLPMSSRHPWRRAIMHATSALLVVTLGLPTSLRAQDPPATPSIPPGGPAAASAMPVAPAQPRPMVTLPAMPDDAELPSLADTVLAPPVLPADPDLLATAATTARQVDAMAIEQWSLPVLADSLEGDADAAFRLVRDRIGLDVYPGILRGPEGTLAARAGNAWDRALLLRALLDRMRIQTRIVVGDLDDATTARVLEQVLADPLEPLQDGRAAAIGTLDVGALGDRARRDIARLRGALGDSIEQMTAPTLGDLAPEVADHVWLQMRWGTGWRDLDPTLPETPSGTPLTSIREVLTEPPSDLRHTVRVQLIAGALSDDRVSDSVVLDQLFDASTAASQQLFLYFQPRAEGLGGVIDDTLSGVQSWTPVLLVDGEGVEGTSFAAGGRGTDLFGDAVDQPPLATLRLVVTRHAPGLPDVSGTHWLVDRIPAALEGTEVITADQLAPLPGDEAGPLAMGVVERIIVSTGGASAYAVAVQRGVAADFMYRLASDPETADERPFGDLLYPVAAGTNVLVTGSEQVSVPALGDAGRVRAWVAAPRVTLVDIGQDPTDAGMFGLSTDLLIDDVRVVARAADAVPDAVRRTIWYGALQSALESTVAQRQASGLTDTPVHLTGISFADAPFVRLDAGSDITGPSALTGALTAGRIALAPTDTDPPVAWWEIDPAMGATRAVLDPGLGGVNGKVAWGSIKHRPPPPRITGPNGPNTWVYDPKTGRIVRQPPGGGGAPQGPPPSRCGGGQEYVTILGCVSVPAAWAIRFGVGLVVSAVLADVVIYLVT